MKFRREGAELFLADKMKLIIVLHNFAIAPINEWRCIYISPMCFCDLNGYTYKFA